MDIKKNKLHIPKKLWHTLSPEWIIEELSTSRHEGLTSELATERLSKYGKNELEEKKGRTPLRILLSQFNDFMIWILIAAAFISGALIRELTDTIVILVVIIINSIMGFVQEYKAEKAIQALKELASPASRVLRDGKEQEISSNLIVPGDIIKLVSGDLVPADCRILEQVNLQTNESPLTGESTPVQKTIKILDKPNLTVGDRANMLFSGTTVSRGRCIAAVVETGKETEIGKIASLVQEKEDPTLLQKELKTIGQKIGVVCIAVSIIVFGSGILKGNPLAEMLLVAVALAVASIPEGLPAIVTISLAVGVQKMAKNNALVRKLSSVETLGGVTVICTDKTGTLTLNQMMARKIFTGVVQNRRYSEYISGHNKQNLDAGENEALKYLLETALLCNDAYFIENGGPVCGEPTEAALLHLGRSYSLDKGRLEKIKPRKMEEPFDPARKMMSTIHEDGQPGSYIMYAKGAPEIILDSCTRIIKNGKIAKITYEDREKIIKNYNRMAEDAMRTLAFAFKRLKNLPGQGKVSEEEKELIYCGMVGMLDPPRPEACKAIKQCKKANIKIIMVTGDHKLTAKAIGRDLGLLEEGDKIVSGEEFDTYSKEELQNQIEDIRIFARVSPANKVAIVDALKKNNHIVAMTGDGINDAPSLKKADIGISMGITGTDVSKEASGMILTDDNFATIVKSIKQGRVIYDNLKKFILFLISCNISEILLMFVAIVFGDFIFNLLFGVRFLYIPLLPVQILWGNLITDGLPAMALGLDPPEKNIMDRKAVKNKEKILSRRSLNLISWQGLILTFGALFIYFAGPFIFGFQSEFAIRTFQTSVFTTVVISQLFHTLNFRFENKGIFHRGILANKFLNLAIFASLCLQVTIIYTPWLQGIFNTAALTLNHWILIAVSSIFPVLIINLINEIRYSRHRKGR